MNNNENTLTIWYILPALVLYLLIFSLKLSNNSNATDYLIPVYVLYMLILSLKGLDKNLLLLNVALFFALAGDIMINLTPYRAGAAVFSLTHICLALFYLRKSAFGITDLFRLVPVAAISFIFCISVFDDTSHATLKIMLSVYMSILAVMLWRAACVIGKNGWVKIFVGSLLFYLTDLAVILGLTYHNRLFVIITWAIYPPALFLLATIDKKIIFKHHPQRII